MLEEPSWRVVHEAVSVMSPDTTDRLYFGDSLLAFTMPPDGIHWPSNLRVMRGLSALARLVCCHVQGNSVLQPAAHQCPGDRRVAYHVVNGFQLAAES